MLWHFVFCAVYIFIRRRLAHNFDCIHAASTSSHRRRNFGGILMQFCLIRSSERSVS